MKKSKTRLNELLNMLQSDPETTSRALGPVISYRALIGWKDGMPVLLETPSRISDEPESALRSLMRKCLDLPYTGPDPSLQGLSQGEAMVVNLTRDAARGVPEARTAVLDRLLGRPQQNISSVVRTGSLSDFLDKISAETRTVTVDITPNPPDPNDEEL